MDPEPTPGLAPHDLALAVAQAVLVTGALLVPLGVLLLGLGADPWVEGSVFVTFLGPRARPLQVAGACLLVVSCALAWRRARAAEPPAPWLGVAEKSQLGAAGAVLGVWGPHLVLFALGETTWLGSPTLVVLGASAGASLLTAVAFRPSLVSGGVAGALGGGAGTLLGYFAVGCPMVLLAAPLAALIGVPGVVALIGALANGCIAAGALLAIRALAELFDLE